MFLNSAVLFTMLIGLLKKSESLRCYMCDDDMNHKEIECLPELTSCIIVWAEIREFNKTLVVKGCQEECFEGVVDLDGNVTVKTECCSDNLCNLFSKNNQNEFPDHTPIGLVRLEPVEFGLEGYLEERNATNSIDRLITGPENGASVHRDHLFFIFCVHIWGLFL